MENNLPIMILYPFGGTRRFVLVIKFAFNDVKPALIIRGIKRPKTFERLIRVKLKFRFPIASGPPSIIATGYRSLILGRADVFPAIALRQSTFYLANSIVNTHHVMSLQ